MLNGDKSDESIIAKTRSKRVKNMDPSKYLLITPSCLYGFLLFLLYT